MPQTSPERPLARLTTELRLTGVGQFALGLSCLVVALTGSDLDPVRAIVPFAVAAAAMGAFSAYGSRWLRLAETGVAPEDARREDPSATMRRSLIKVAVALVLVAVAVGLGPAFAAVFGGLLCGAGAAELRDYTWLRDREKALGREIHRELGRFPLAGGGRVLYTRPTSESTLAT
jgi:hypothetical protein